MSERNAVLPETAAPRGRGADVVSIAISEPHELVVAGLTRLIDTPSSGRYRVTGDPRVTPDVVLYGVDHRDHPDPHDPELHSLLRSTPATVIATYWDDPSPAVEAALSCGAHGALCKTLPRQGLLDTIQAIIDDRAPQDAPPADGECDPVLARAGLTPRQLDVLRLVAMGLTNPEIGDELYLTINSVKTYIRGAYRKIGVERRAQAVVWAERHGLVPREPAVPGFAGDPSPGGEEAAVHPGSTA